MIDNLEGDIIELCVVNKNAELLPVLCSFTPAFLVHHFLDLVCYHLFSVTVFYPKQNQAEIPPCAKIHKETNYKGGY
jgi:hypothetical protein